MENKISKATLTLAEEYTSDFLMAVFEAAPFPLCLFRAVKDENNVPFDYEYVLVNKASINSLGGKNPVGERYSNICKTDNLGLLKTIKKSESGKFSFTDTDYYSENKDSKQYHVIHSGSEHLILVSTMQMNERPPEQKQALPGSDLRLLLESIPGMVVLHDLADKKTLYSNRNYRSFIAEDPDDVRLMINEENLFSRIHPDDWERSQEFLMQTAYATEEDCEVEVRMMTESQGWKNVLLKSKIFQTGGQTYSSQCLISVQELVSNDSKKNVFQNISHEFRTPLTLIRGALEELLEHQQAFPGSIRSSIELSFRNTLRLQRMVNTLLDFSGLHSGMTKPCFKPVDITTLTADLAGSFRSAIERSGMQLNLNIESIEEAFYVDKDMWEKIVLNLISNAFKYSYKGKIEVSLKKSGKYLELSVQDTGIGIPNSELKKIFEKFYRVNQLQARSRDGAGIGLSLVRELVKLHKGNIKVKSKVGSGSVFTVTMPLGKDHLPAENVMESFSIPLSDMKDAYVAEALKWVPGNQLHEVINDLEEPPFTVHNSESRPCVLLVDDNPDMRDYLKRLLSGQYRVAQAADNEKALHQLKQFLPDLVICDSGLNEPKAHELLRSIKDNRETAHIPVIMISSRSGEESKLEYIDEGADDYLLKPFSAKELLSRIGLTIKVARTRRHSERNLRNIIMQAPVGIVILKGEDFIVEEVNANYLKIVDLKRESFRGRSFFESLPYLKNHLSDIFSDVVRTGTAYTENEMMLEMRRQGKKEKCYFNIVFHPLKEEDNSISGIMGVVNEITGQVIMRKEVEESEKRFKAVADSAPVMIWMTSPDGKCTFLNKPWSDFTGIPTEQGMGDGWTSAVHPDDKKHASETFRNALEDKREYTLQFRLKRYDGLYRWIYDHAVPRYNNEGDFLGYIGSAIDIHEQKASREELEIKVTRRTMQLFNTNLELKQSNEQLEQFAYIASHDLQEPLRKIKTYTKLIENSGQIKDGDSKLYLSKIGASSSRMSDLIRDILNYSRLSKHDELFRKTDLNKIIENVKTDFELIIQEKNVQIKCDELPVVNGIPLQLEQLFTNLISNSIKFSSENPEIKISATIPGTDELKHFPQIDPEKKYWKISVLDNGIGFDQKYAEKIFTIFQRLNSRSEYEGTGIGLALCKKIVLNHKGAIFAQGKSGKGAEFCIILPG